MKIGNKNATSEVSNNKGLKGKKLAIANWNEVCSKLDKVGTRLYGGVEFVKYQGNPLKL